MVAFYITCILFIVVILGVMLWAVTRVNILRSHEVPRARVPAHRRHVLVGIRPSLA